MTVRVEMSGAEAEALVSFLSERIRVWRQHARDCGVELPDELPRKLAVAHANAVKRIALDTVAAS